MHPVSSDKGGERGCEKDFLLRLFFSFVIYSPPVVLRSRLFLLLSPVYKSMKDFLKRYHSSLARWRERNPRGTLSYVFIVENITSMNSLSYDTLRPALPLSNEEDKSVDSSTY